MNCWEYLDRNGFGVFLILLLAILAALEIFAS